jgi:hypothetical protein
MGIVGISTHLNESAGLGTNSILQNGQSCPRRVLVRRLTSESERNAKKCEITGNS